MWTGDLATLPWGSSGAGLVESSVGGSQEPWQGQSVAATHCPDSIGTQEGRPLQGLEPGLPSLVFVTARLPEEA